MIQEINEMLEDVKIDLSLVEEELFEVIDNIDWANEQIWELEYILESDEIDEEEIDRIKKGLANEKEYLASNMNKKIELENDQIKFKLQIEELEKQFDDEREKQLDQEYKR